MDAAAFWLLTYLLHSSLLLAAAALFRLALGDRRLVLQEALLRAAILGGFVTASLQVGLGVRPLGGALAVPGGRAAVATARSLAGEAVASVPVAPIDARVRPAETPALPEVATSAVVGRWFGRLPWAWQDVLAGAWTALALLALTRLVVAAVRLRQLLRQRRPLAGRDLGLQPWLAAEALGLRRVRLSAAPRLAVPLATGVLWPEVCLPTRVLEDLAPEERTALCAHELAHLARRDPAWILLARLIEALAPLQPLNRWARSRLQDIAECLSDDLAVAACGRRLGLARSLVDVASWALVGNVAQPALAAGALSVRSRLGHRVERLMDPVRLLERPRRVLLPLSVALVVATAFLTPVVWGTPPDEKEKPTPALAPPAPSEPVAPALAPLPAKPAKPAKPGRPSALTPAASAVPAPPAPPAPADAPVAPDAPAPPAAPALAGERAAEIKVLEAEIEALVSSMQPWTAELERLGGELERAADGLARAAVAEHESGTSSTATAEARRRFEEAREKLRAAARDIRPSAEDVRHLREKARALAELSRPSREDLRELRRASEQAAREARQAMPDVHELLRSVRETMVRVREQLREVEETTRLRADEVRKAREERHRAAEERRRADEERRRAEERHAPRPDPDKP